MAEAWPVGHLHLITAEDPLTLRARARELIRFPQLTMVGSPDPAEWRGRHCDEIVSAVVPTCPATWSELPPPLEGPQPFTAAGNRLLWTDFRGHGAIGQFIGLR